MYFYAFINFLFDISVIIQIFPAPGAIYLLYGFYDKILKIVDWPWKSFQLFNITNFINFSIKIALLKILSFSKFLQPLKSF